MNAPVSVKDLVLAHDKKDWFVADRFGMFIHWGLYSLRRPARMGEEPRGDHDEDYQKYFDHFDPDLYDPQGMGAPRARRPG